jgi:hypothetical protein
MSFDTILSILMGIGLSAAVGFRIFIPFLIASIASLTGYINLSDSFNWIGTVPALITFSAATLIEILAYYIPWLDNILDTIASPIAVIAGAIIMVSVITDISPLLKWVLAIIAGGSITASIQSLTGFLRMTSSVTTGGVGNPVVSTAEAGSSFLLSITAILLPVVAVIIVLTLIIITFKKIAGRFFKTKRR